MPVANDALFVDDMDDPSSGWGLADNELVTIGYQGGALRLVVHNAGGAGYTPHALGGSFGVVIAVNQFELADSGGVGALCGDDSGALYGAVITTVGELVFFTIADGAITVLDRVPDTGVDVPLNEAGVFAVECHGMATGALRLVALMGDTGPLGIYQSDEGPDTFRSVALYAEGDNAEFTVDFTHGAAYGISGSDTAITPTPEGEELLTHVPSLWRDTCVEAPVVGGNADAILHCVLQADGTGAELLQYASFADSADMDAGYQEAVEAFGVESTGDCGSGPDETTWNAGDGPPLGRLQCAPQAVGIRFDWTDDRLAILSGLIDFDGDYQNTYVLWTEAGPI